MAASAAPSAQATPAGLSAPGSSDFGDFPNDEEEDRKPNLEYLDSLNDYRKRSRSREDVGSVKVKVAKMDAPLVYDYGAVNGYTPDGGIEIEQDAIMIEEIPPPFEGEEDPMVNGPPFCSLLYISFAHLPSSSERCPEAIFTGHGRRP